MYSCFLCQAQFGTIDLLKAHFVFGPHSVHMLSTFTCQQANCRMRSGSLKVFISHLRNAHGNAQGNAGGILLADHPNEPNPPENNEHPNEDNFDNYNNVNENIDNPNEFEFDGAGDGDPPIEPITVENFIRVICKNSAVLAASLSSIPNVNRTNITTFISLVSDFLQCGIVNALKDKVVNLFDLCDNPDIRGDVADVKVMFDLLSDPFESIATEYRRLSFAEDDGHYVKPEPFVMFHRDKYQNNNGNVALIREPATGQIVHLGRVFKYLFEIPLMFNSVQNYMNSLLNDTVVIRNFIQGDLWQEELANFQGKVAIPLHMHFDDYESGNCLGSHAGDQSLGALYASIPCLPPHLSSCVQNMFLSALFLSNDRKEASNLVAFGSVIDQLIQLKENGVLLNLAQGETRVYFCFCLIVADNKGNNAIQGLVESFRSFYYCRICKMHRDDASFSCHVPNNLLRNVANYEADIAVNDFRETGLHENCVWNRVPGYHVTRNINCDVLHDMYEGLVNFTLSPMLYYFIRTRNYFDIETLCSRIESFDFGPDVGNKPPISHITLDRLQSDNLNLGGCEMLCLARYLSEIIGDLVPQNNPFWKLYLLVREILLIISCPYFSTGTELYLGTLIREHHELYLQLFNKLMKPRHHLLLHYPECMRRNGPVVSTCTLTSERKHRQGKLYVRAMNSRVNLPLSVSVKTQLQLSDHFLKLGEKVLNAEVGTNLVYHKKVLARSLAGFERFAHLLPFDNDQCISSVRSVDISGTKYCVGMIIVTNVAELYPQFAKIVHIVSNNGSEFGFVLNVKHSVMYHEHFAAYEVEDTQSFIYLFHRDFVSHVPLWERLSVDGAKFVSLRISL